MENKFGVPYEGFAEFARKVAAQGAVLIQNEGSVLPFQEKEKVAVFGRCQIDYYRSGTGSGGAVHVPYAVNLIEGLKNSGKVQLNDELLQTYKEWISKHPFDNGGGGWAAEPWNQEEMPLTTSLCEEAAEHSNKAIIVIGRTAGEDKDNADAQGSYRLTEKEQNMIDKVTDSFEDTVVLLNVPGIIDMSWLQKKYRNPIKTVIYAWHGGMEGGNAIADVLTGKVTPSGKLADSIAYNIEDYPSTKNYGDSLQNLYEEDIYVGYRYFETFAPERVMYEFGFGLSYTQFSITVKEAQIKNAQEKDTLIHLPVLVKNTGDTYSGKEVVQIYVSAPQGKLGKPAKVLAGYQKTKLLAPGESQEMTIDVPITGLASYDDSGVTGHKSCYVLEAGEYQFFAGNSVRNTEHVMIAGNTGYVLAKTQVVEELSEALAPVQKFSVMKPGKRRTDGSYELIYGEVAVETTSLRDKILKNLPESFPVTGDRGIHLQDVADGKANIKDFVAQLSAEDMAMMVRGEGMSNPLVTPGTASAFGGVTEKLYDYGIPFACCADGPSGIRMEGGLNATQVPIGTLLSATWDDSLIEEMYVFEGKELLRNEVDVLLGPGLNLRRNPLNGRNFEYFSEDPLLTGQMAAAIVRGVMAGGCNATLKHFACNSQEKDRFQVEAVVSERAIRELYLKGFEIAIKNSDANCVMTAYSPINGHYSASNYDLNTTILRKEWGFKGIVMTDWWGRMNDVIEGGEPNHQQTASMIRAQNDLFMVVNNSGAPVNPMGDDTMEALKNGKLTIGELQRNIMNICSFLIHTPVFERKPEYGGRVVNFTPKAVLPDEKRSGEVITLGETGEIDVSSAGKTIILNVEKEVVYLVEVDISSNAPRIAQATTNLLLNGEVMGTLQCAGTEGRWFRQKISAIGLKKGYYELALQELSPGLVLKNMYLKAK